MPISLWFCQRVLAAGYRVALAATLAAATVVIHANVAHAQLCRGNGPVTELGRIENTRPAKILSRSNTRERLASPDSNISYMRPHLTVSGQNRNTRWTLSVHDPSLRTLQVYTEADFTERSDAWAARMHHSELWFSLSDLENADDLEIAIDSFLALPAQSEKNPFYFSVQGDDLDDAAWRPVFSQQEASPYSALAGPVALLLVAIPPKPISCTAVAIARDLLLTNWHCGPFERATAGGIHAFTQFFWSPEHCRNTFVDFSWDGDGVSRDFTCTEVVAKSEDLDYALLRIAPSGLDGAVPVARLKRDRPSESEMLTLVHHPLAAQKQITAECPFGEDIDRESWRGNKAGSEFEHLCDSEAGSSGAPIFDSGGYVIGLHHLGFARDERTCAPTDSVNKAVWIDAILDDLEARLEAGELGILVRELGR